MRFSLKYYQQDDITDSLLVTFFRQVIDEVLTLMVAGHDTTTTVLSWAIWYLAHDAALSREVAAEADGVIAEAGLAAIKELGLTGRVVKEAMRIRPPAWALDRQVLFEKWSDVSLQEMVQRFEMVKEMAQSRKG